MKTPDIVDVACAFMEEFRSSGAMTVDLDPRLRDNIARCFCGGKITRKNLQGMLDILATEVERIAPMMWDSEAVLKKYVPDENVARGSSKPVVLMVCPHDVKIGKSYDIPFSVQELACQLLSYAGFAAQNQPFRGRF